MSRVTLVVLLIVVAGLGALAWRMSAKNALPPDTADVALFPGIDPASVRALRIENTTSDQHIRIERDANGSWRMTDPTEVPAEASIVDYLLTNALSRSGTPVPSTEADPARVGLDPPRLVLEIEHASAGGAPVRARVEFGALDPDGQRVHVRVGGRILRTWRDLDTTLDRPMQDFRAKRLFDVDGRTIVEIHRSGTVTGTDGRPIDMALDALAENGEWIATGPVKARLDPLGVSLVCGALAQLEVLDYADFGSSNLADWGLDPAEVTLDLATPSGPLPTMRLGRRGHSPLENWNLALEGSAWVYTIDPSSARLLISPLDDLFDHRLVRVAREEVDALELRAGERTLEIARRKKQWFLRERQGAGEWGPEAPADRTKVEDLLGVLDRHELARMDRTLKLEAADVRGAIHVRVGADESTRQGGELGEPYDLPQGARAVRFRRDGDEVVAEASDELWRIATTPFEALQSLRVQELVEVEQAGLQLDDLTTQRRFVRGGKGLWQYQGFAAEAKELRDVLDPLLFLTASRHLKPADVPQLERSIKVTFVDVNEQPHEFVVALAKGGELDGQVILQKDGRLSVAKDQTLHEKLAALMQKKQG